MFTKYYSLFAVRYWLFANRYLLFQCSIQQNDHSNGFSIRLCRIGLYRRKQNHRANSEQRIAISEFVVNLDCFGLDLTGGTQFFRAYRIRPMFTKYYSLFAIGYSLNQPPHNIIAFLFFKERIYCYYYPVETVHSFYPIHLTWPLSTKERADVNNHRYSLSLILRSLPTLSTIR